MYKRVNKTMENFQGEDWQADQIVQNHTNDFRQLFDRHRQEEEQSLQHHQHHQQELRELNEHYHQDWERKLNQAGQDMRQLTEQQRRDWDKAVS